MLISNPVRGKAATPVSSRTIYSKLTTIYITKKLIKFGDVVYQFCNVTGFKITEVNVINTPDGKYFIFLPIGCFLTFININFWGAFLFTITVVIVMLNILPKKYGLEVSMNSGEKAVFTTNDLKGLKTVIAELSKFIESENERENCAIDINARNITFARYIENQARTWADFGSASLYEHLNQQTKTYETSANSEDTIAQTLACIREANLAGNLTTEVPATWATIHLAQVIKSQGLIANFELVADATSKHLLLHLNPKGNNSSTDKIADSQFDWLNQDFPKEILPLLQDLESEDPAVRAKAVLSLGEFYRERTK